MLTSSDLVAHPSFKALDFYSPQLEIVANFEKKIKSEIAKIQKKIGFRGRMYWYRLLNRAEEGCRGEVSRQSLLKTFRPTPFFFLVFRYIDFQNFKNQKFSIFNCPFLYGTHNFFFKKFPPSKVHSSKFQNQFQQPQHHFCCFSLKIKSHGWKCSIVSIFCDTIKNVKVMVFRWCHWFSTNIP